MQLTTQVNNIIDVTPKNCAGCRHLFIQKGQNQEVWYSHYCHHPDRLKIKNDYSNPFIQQTKEYPHTREFNSKGMCLENTTR
jgi:hypothetical protein